jgi:hypothetical protein
MYTSYFATLAASPWIEAAQILFFGLITSLLIYFFIGGVFRSTGIEKLIHKLLWHSTRIGRDPIPRAIGKYLAVFIFLLFLRSAVEKAGYHDVESFLDSVVEYLPHLLLALLIAFFGLQVSRTTHSLVYKTVHFDNPRTAVILAYIARILILFFTFTIAMNQINTGPVEIIPEYLIRSLLIGIVAAGSLAFGLAFGLGGRKAASEFIEEYVEDKDEIDKDLKK